VDVFVHERNDNPDDLASRINALTPTALALQMITNRGIKVWPDGFSETFCTDHWRCRYMSTSGNQTVTPKDVLTVLSQLTEAGIDVIKTENLYTFDGQLGFALGQGQ
jgi:isocitrate dehydrogenase